MKYHMCAELTHKQKFQLEIITADEYLEQLVKLHPESSHIINPLRDSLGVIVHFVHGVDVRELCSPFSEELK
jgi:hypothetical protein